MGGTETVAEGTASLGMIFAFLVAGSTKSLLESSSVRDGKALEVDGVLLLKRTSETCCFKARVVLLYARSARLECPVCSCISSSGTAAKCTKISIGTH